jgi:hypothetical protein
MNLNFREAIYELAHAMSTIQLQLKKELKANPYNKALQSQVTKNKVHVSALLNVLDITRGRAPQHFSSDPYHTRQISQCMKDVCDEAILLVSLSKAKEEEEILTLLATH